MGRFTAFTTGVLFGAVAGGIAALMFTPKNGEENRQLVADYANTLANSAQKYGAQAQGVVQSGLKSATEISGEFVDNVKTTANSAGEQFTEKNDELRAKIEAARDRIAEQVKKNNDAEEEPAKEDKEEEKAEKDPEKKAKKKSKKDEEK